MPDLNGPVPLDCEAYSVTPGPGTHQAAPWLNPMSERSTEAGIRLGRHRAGNLVRLLCVTVVGLIGHAHPVASSTRPSTSEEGHHYLIHASGLACDTETCLLCQVLRGNPGRPDGRVEFPLAGWMSTAISLPTSVPTIAHISPILPRAPPLPLIHGH